MADTFNNDLRVREQEAGSNSGTWGGLLNTTISNLASAFGQGSEAIPNASTHTITLADGAADEARSMYLKCTGGGQACTVTLAPNTISKVWIISNETSFTLTFSQGSGANVAVAAGAVKMIVTDGAGATGAVTDALSSLSANLSGATITGDISFGDNDKAIFGAGSDLELFYNGTHSVFKDGSAGNIYIQDDNNIILGSIGGENYLVATKDGAVTLYHDAVAKLATTSTGIDVTGTVVSDGLTVGATSAPTISIEDSDGGFTASSFSATNGGRDLTIKAPQEVVIQDADTGNKWLRIDEGDISFYEDTGTTPKLFWDASAESLGIGTSSPSASIDVVSSGTNSQSIAKFSSASGKRAEISTDAQDDAFMYLYDSADAVKVAFRTDGNASYISGGGDVGIGTSSPSDLLDISANGTSAMRLSDSSSPATYAQFTQANGVLTFAADAGNAQTGSNIQFEVDGSEAMRISGGNLLVGKTVTSLLTAGIALNSNGAIYATVDSERPLILNRETSDGSIAEFRKDNTAVGSIGTNSSRFELDGSGNPVRMKAGTSNIQVNNNTHISFDTAGTEAMRISSGNLLVGDTSVIRGSSQTGVSVEAVGRIHMSRGTGTGGFGHLVFYNGNGAVGSVSTSGSATAYNTSSDQRLKENIADADDAGSKVDAIQVRKFDWIADGSHQDYGMVAQELQSVAPEAVSGDADSEEMMGVDYSKLVPMLVKEIQSLRARVAQLES